MYLSNLGTKQQMETRSVLVHSSHSRLLRTWPWLVQRLVWVEEGLMEERRGEREKEERRDKDRRREKEE